MACNDFYLEHNFTEDEKNTREGIEYIPPFANLNIDWDFWGSIVEQIEIKDFWQNKIKPGAPAA